MGVDCIFFFLKLLVGGFGGGKIPEGEKRERGVNMMDGHGKNS